MKASDEKIKCLDVYPEGTDTIRFDYQSGYILLTQQEALSLTEKIISSVRNQIVTLALNNFKDINGEFNI